MDDIVRAALAKWPNVPDCFGWLAMDARGDFYMRDDRTQAAGEFGSSRAARGSRVEHDKLLAFIHRNYSVDEHGRWFFQNGPQRVYVDLEVTPLVWRVNVARSSSVAGAGNNDPLSQAWRSSQIGVGARVELSHPAQNPLASDDFQPSPYPLPSLGEGHTPMFAHGLGVTLTSSTGLSAQVADLFTDELGRLFAQAQPSASSAAPLLGLIHTQDVLSAAQAIDSGAWPAPREISSAQLEQLGGFVRLPSAQSKHYRTV